MAVKLALGSLVIVGEEVDFIQRVVVDTAANAQTANLNPVITIATATTNSVSLTFQGIAPASATAAITASSDSSISSPVQLTLGAPSSDPATLTFNLPSSPAPKSLTPNIYYTVVLSVPEVMPLTCIVHVPQAPAVPAQAPGQNPAPPAASALKPQ
jgi:hypothetical protein